MRDEYLCLYTPIREAADEIHSGIITPTKLVAGDSGEINARDGEIQAFVTVIREEAPDKAHDGRT